jgi:integrase
VIRFPLSQTAETIKPRTMAHDGKPTLTVTSGPHSGSQAEPRLRSYKLTPGFVRRIATEVPPVKETVYVDQDVPRHYIRCRPASQPGKPWPVESRVRYTVAGRRVWLTTGNPRTMTLSALREAARAALAIADAGDDPAAARAAKRAAWTVRTLWAAYSVSPDFTRCTPEVRRNVTSKFERHILPRLGHQPIASIDVPMIRRFLRAVATDTRVNSRGRRLGGPGSARKTVHLLNAALTWAICEGELSVNQLRGALRLDGDGTRETVITEAGQYTALFAAMDRLVEAGRLRPAVRAFIVCAALTGMRRGEIQSLIWGQVNFAARRITLTDSKGAKLTRRGGRNETVSLPPLAAAALADIAPAEPLPDRLVFLPSHGRAISVNRDWAAIRKAAGLPAGLTLHSLRHSLGTAAVLAGLSAPEVQQLLRHRTLSTTARYIHLAEAATLRLQDRVAARLTEGIADNPQATVHPLPRKRA